MLPPTLTQETDELDDTLNHNIKDTLTETKQQQEETMKQCRVREELLYNNLEVTALIPVSDGQAPSAAASNTSAPTSPFACVTTTILTNASLLRPKPWVPSKPCGTALI